MKSKRTIIVGIFIFLGLVILVVTVFTLGGQKKSFVKKIAVSVVFNDISGLKEGDNVWFLGVKVGTVKNIELIGNSKVLVTLTIEQKAEPFIHKDAQVKLGSEGLLGNKVVVITGGTASAGIIQKNDRLVTMEGGVSTDEIMATFQVNNKNLQEITNNLKTVSRNLAAGKGSIGKLINDPAIADNLNSTITNFNHVATKTNSTVDQLQLFTQRMNKEGSSLNQFLEDTVIFGNLQASIIQLNEAVNNAKDFSENLKKIGQQMNNDNNAVGVLLKDETVAGQLRVIMQNLQSSSEKLDEDLEALQHNFLFRGFFRKKAKAEAKSQ